MIEQLTDMPDGTLGFRASGEVTADDYRDVMMGPVEALARAGHNIRMLYVVGEDFDRYSVGAMWEDARFGIAEHIHWERVAFVTDVEWMRHLVGGFGWMVPGRCKVFGLGELETAKDWLVAAD